MREYGVPGRPVVLAGAASHWPAMQWTLPGFRHAYGHVRIKPHHGNIVQSTEETTLGEFMDGMASDRTGRFLSWPYPLEHPELVDTFRLPSCLAENWAPPKYHPTLLWIIVSPPGSGLRLHRDIYWSSAWNAQMVGRKRWTFCAPQDDPWVYNGQVNTFEPDLATFPLFERATVYETVAEPGDIVYVPSRWWHQTRSVDAGLALTGNYTDRTNYRTVMAYMQAHGMHDLLAEFRRQIDVELARPQAQVP